MEYSFETLWPYLIVFFVASLVTTYFYEKKRTEALKLIASQLGFAFNKGGRAVTRSKHDDFELFSKGSSKKVKNEMWGKDRHNNVSLFGYSYIQGSGKNSTTYTQTVLSMEVVELNLPNFALKPENALHKIGQFFGYQDIDFDSSPRFSKNYLLRGESETTIRELFTPSVLKYFEKNNNICIEGRGNTLIFYYHNSRCEPEDIKTFYERGKTALSCFIKTARH